MEKEHILYDELGYEWRYNPEQERLYMVEAEKEFDPNRENIYDNGYFCDSLEEATEVLRDSFGIQE